MGYKIQEETVEIAPSSGDAGSMWSDYEFGKPAFACEFYDDFLYYDTGHYVVTETAAACTQLLADTRNGVLVLTADAAENAGTQLQLGNATTGEAFAPEAGKTLWFECRIASNDADQNDVFVGFHIQDTAVIASLGTDYIGFQILDESAAINGVSSASSVVTTQSALSTATDDGWVKLGFKVTGTSRIDWWVNDVLRATTTTSIPTALMQLTIAHLTGEAVANTLSIDYVAVAQTR